MGYKVTYILSQDDDCCSVWSDAKTKQEAIDEVNSEYWDVKEIISVTKI